MIKQLNLTTCALAMIFTAGSLGCSAGFKSGNVTPENAASHASNGGNTDQIVTAQAAAMDGQKAIDAATLALASLINQNGQIDLSLFASAGSGVLAPIIAELKPKFDEAYAKISEVKTKFDASKAKLAVEIAKMDPADPTAKSLTEQLTKINDLETQFINQIHIFAGRLTDVNTALDKLVAQATVFIPIPGLSVIAGFLIDTLIMHDLKALILELQTKLLAL